MGTIFCNVIRQECCMQNAEIKKLLIACKRNGGTTCVKWYDDAHRVLFFDFKNCFCDIWNVNFLIKIWKIRKIFMVIRGNFHKIITNNSTAQSPRLMDIFHFYGQIFNQFTFIDFVRTQFPDILFSSGLRAPISLRTHTYMHLRMCI